MNDLDELIEKITYETISGSDYLNCIVVYMKNDKFYYRFTNKQNYRKRKDETLIIKLSAFDGFSNYLSSLKTVSEYSIKYYNEHLETIYSLNSLKNNIAALIYNKMYYNF